MQPVCVCCGSEALSCVGRIPPFIHFSGRVLSKPIEGGKLYRCKACGLAFRYPRLDYQVLNELYKKGHIENWQSPSSRNDWQYAYQWISRYLPNGGDLLDVGCFDGGFLQNLDSCYKRHGVEIHEGAGAKARECGIQLVGTDFYDLSDISLLFDAVVSFDVIEHAYDPFTFLSHLVGKTRNNGIVVVSTGNSDFLGWKLMGARYWYCSIGEHLSFINPRWCNWAAPRLGINLVKVVKFSHSQATWGMKASEILKNLIYMASPRGFSVLRKVGLGESEYRKYREMIEQPPRWMSASDHFICLFVKE